MGRVTVRVQVANQIDLYRAQAGDIPPDQVRRVEIEGIVDSGATRLVLPESVGQQLGLVGDGQVRFRYGDQRAELRPLVHNVWLKMEGRESSFSAVLEPKRTNALIGAIVMEELDMIVDCITQKVVTRDPNIVVAEIE